MFLGTVEGVPTKWGPELKRATALTSRSMFTPFLESFPDDVSVEAVGQTYSALLVTNDADGIEPAQPARRRYTKKQTVPKILLTRTANVTEKRTMTRKRRVKSSIQLKMDRNECILQRASHFSFSASRTKAPIEHGP